MARPVQGTRLTFFIHFLWLNFQSREVSVIFLVFVHEESEVWRSEALAEGTQVEKGFVEQDFRSSGFCSKIHTVSMATCCLLCNRRPR